MLKRALTAVAFTLIPSVGLASPAIITSDVRTGIILSSNNIDNRQDPYLAGKIALLFIGLNDIIAGDLDPDAPIKYPNGSTLAFANVLQDAASDSSSSPVSITLAASKVAQSPAILNERINALFKAIGMRATSMQTIRTSSGQPNWSGFTTSRDIARITTALVNTHGDYARGLLPKTNVDDFGFSGSWLYHDGQCISVTITPQISRELVSVIQGAASEHNCASAAMVSFKANDRRIQSTVRSDR